MIKRNIIIEKWKMYDYIDNVGCRIWIDKYGEVIRAEDKNGKAVWVGRKGLSYLDHGFVFAPYIPAVETTSLVFRDINDGRLKCRDIDGNITVISA